VADVLRIVLVAPRNPLNIGAAARAMSNFGFSQLRLVNPYDVAFKEARSAVHSQYILENAELFETVGEAVADCALVAGTTAGGRRDLHLPLYRLEPAGELLRERLHADRPVALLFGSEKFGLSNEDMSHCQWLLRIPARDEHGSMNLGQAVAICLYELRRDGQAAAQRFDPAPSATAQDYERITSLLLDVLERSGYLNPSTAESSELKVRRLIRRLGMPAADTDMWLGIFRQILWKVGKSL
jgi:TrmH family RNA methyltransferase